jgi:hypothetical protein
MTRRLLHSLLKLSLTTPDGQGSEQIEEMLRCAHEKEWEQTVLSMRLHRLLPIVSYFLTTYGLTHTVPSPYLPLLQSAHRQTRRKNAILLLALGRILEQMQAKGLHPVIWKGAVLVDSFYPDLGTRLMGDLDFALPRHELSEATSIFESLGFSIQEQMETSDAVYFANEAGILCDVHHRVRLFEGQNPQTLTLDLQPKQMRIPTLTALEPNAMLVHLLVHMDGHRSEMGPLLSWILDLVFVLREWGHLIELERLKALMPASENLMSLFRILRFLEQEFDEPLPCSLANAVCQVVPLTLDEILRHRRLAMWELPYPRGWVRLGASRLGYKFKQYRPDLDTSDLRLWVSDALTLPLARLRPHQRWTSLS